MRSAGNGRLVSDVEQGYEYMQDGQVIDPLWEADRRLLRSGLQNMGNTG